MFPRTLVVGALACAVTALYHRAPQVAIEPAPFTSSGVILGLLLVFRRGAGYDRWWEARVLWGGITNQCRNLVVSARAYGPADPVWQQTFARWVAAFAHAVRGGLRGERVLPELRALVGAEASEEVTAAKHMPLDTMCASLEAELLAVPAVTPRG